jgi:predicted RNA-binding protein with PIN domain
MMHYGEMPRVTLGSSDLRSQVAIFGEWNIYGTRKKYFVKFQTNKAYLKKKRSTDKKLKSNKKTNCPKFIDIQWNKRRNKVGTIRA